MSQSRSMRWHLLQVQLVGIVPIGLFAAVLLYLHWHVQDEERQRSQIESVRLLAAAVDNALDSTVERLAIFARLWSSSSLSEEAIYDQARQALAVNVDWKDIVAFDATGRGVFRTDAPFGAAVPSSIRFDVWRPVFSERRPVVSDVNAGFRPGAHWVAVGVPVTRGDRVAYVLIASLDPTWYDRLLNKQGQPHGAVAALFDRRFKFVARSSEGDARRGGDPTPKLVSDMQRQREGLNRYTNLNGTNVYTAWTFTRHGWGVGFGTPSAPVDSALWIHLLWFGLLWAAAVGASVIYAAAKARPVAAALHALAGQAQHIAAGQRITGLPDAHVAEVNSALSALQGASELLQSTMRERDRSLATEREARAAAEAANDAKDEFLAMLGHELRNPLAAISNAASLVQQGDRGTEQLDFAAGVIERQSRHLKHLIDDLLDMGRAMTGKILLEHRPVNLAESARHVLATLQTAGRLDQRKLNLDLQPVWVYGDQTRLEQIMTNLLVNAARYTQPGGHIRVRVGSEGASAIIEVCDDGRGIGREALPRVFDLFFQAEATADRAAGGLGIGLTLVQRLARLHGGRAEAASAGPDRGAAFTVTLPAIAAPCEETSAPKIANAAGEGSVLIVEDNADARDSLSAALELKGYRVLPSADGPEALDLLRREQPSAAVLDIGLPGMNGYELARRIRTECGAQTVLIALTGYGTAHDQRLAAEAGFDRHMTKPVDVDELCAELEATRRAKAHG